MRTSLGLELDGNINRYIILCRKGCPIRSITNFETVYMAQGQVSNMHGVKVIILQNKPEDSNRHWK